jgi:hypothetical protein
MWRLRLVPRLRFPLQAAKDDTVWLRMPGSVISNAPTEEGEGGGFHFQFEYDPLDFSFKNHLMDLYDKTHFGSMEWPGKVRWMIEKTDGFIRTVMGSVEIMDSRGNNKKEVQHVRVTDTEQTGSMLRSNVYFTMKTFEEIRIRMPYQRGYLMDLIQHSINVCIEISNQAKNKKPPFESSIPEAMDGMREFCKNIQDKPHGQDLIPERFHLRKNDNDLVADERNRVVEERKNLAADIMEDWKTLRDTQAFWSKNTVKITKLIELDGWDGRTQLDLEKVYGDDVNIIVYLENHIFAEKDSEQDMDRW